MKLAWRNRGGEARGEILAAKPTQRRLSEALLAFAVASAREPALYTRIGAPDTVEGRFELLTVHVILLVERLSSAGDAELSQALFDRYVSHLDGAMREMGVGDLAMGRRMRTIGQLFYGRARAYGQAFCTLPEVAPLRAVIARTVLAGDDGVDPGPLAGHVVAMRARLAEQEVVDIAGLAASP